MLCPQEPRPRWHVVSVPFWASGVDLLLKCRFYHQILDAYKAGTSAFKDVAARYNLTTDNIDDVVADVQEVSFPRWGAMSANRDDIFGRRKFSRCLNALVSF